MIILTILLIYIVICVIGGIVTYIKNPKPPNGLTYKEYNQYYNNKEWLLYDNEEDNEEDNEDEDAENAALNERRALLDETIIKYNKLLDNLDEQLQYTTDNKKRSVILSKQITTLEKLNRALEKLEKLG